MEEEEEELEENENDQLSKHISGTFFQPPGSDTEIPPFKRLFGRVDQIEPHLPGEAHRLVSFDCINAGFLEEIRFNIGPLHSSENKQVDRNLAIIKAEFSKKRAKALIESGWVFLDVIHDSDSPNAHYSKNLFDEPTNVEIKERTMAELGPDDKFTTGDALTTYLSEQSDYSNRFEHSETPGIKEDLDRIAGWDGISASPRKDVESLIASIPEIDGAVVYDVGQGNCTALLQGDDAVAFFDVGGSVMGNIRSFPDVDASLCTLGTRVIILSHWDWDHWSFSLRDSGLTKVDWVVPIQRKSGPLGLVHSRFVALLQRLKVNIHWIGSKFGTKVFSNGITLVKSDFNKRNRNKSGLVLGVRKTAVGHKLLLPGDGVLKELKPKNQEWRADFIVVPHHGGKTRLKEKPLPERVTKSTLIYSYGAGNIFLHPMATTIRFWRGTKWRKSAHTTIRQSDGMGSIGIDFTKTRVHHGGGCRCVFCPTNVKNWLK